MRERCQGTGGARRNGAGVLKICPNCHTRFDGNEAFCPNDGTALVEAKELSPGALTGTTIGKSVILERLMWSDDFGERYSGRMVDSKAEVHVTVVNPGVPFADDAAKRIEATRAQVSSPLPPEINTLLRTELSHLPSFVIQTAPRGPSLREILDERGTLGWETAARIVCRAARASQWLLDQGVVHWTLHPGSLHVSRLAEGAVQLGEWYFDSLMGNRSPAQRIEANEPFAGYLGVMAPEIAEGHDADARSVVFALGALFFELVTGKPPFAGGDPKATLERLSTESAVKLSIAAGADGVHGELDDIVGMMLAREPEKRLQVPMAAVAVLANVLGTDPDSVAPEIERSEDGFDDELYATTELSAFQRENVPPSEAEEDAPDESDEKPDSADLKSKKTLLMAGALPAIDAEDPPESEAGGDEGESAESNTTPEPEPESRGISGSSSTNDQIDDAAPGAPVVDEVSETEPTNFDSTKTLMMGSIGDKVEAAVQEAEAQQQADAVEANEAHDAAEEAESSARAEVESSDEGETDVPDSQKKTLILTGDDAPAERVPESEIETRETSREAAVEVDTIDPEDTQKLDLASEETERTEEESESPAAAKDEASAGKSEGFQIGFVEAPESAPEADDWFSGTTEAAWERTLAEEHAQESEKRWKMLLTAALALVVLAAFGLFIYSQYIWEPEPEEGEELVEETPESTAAEEEEPEVDIDRLVDRFNRAVEGGRLVEPPGNSAISALADLREHAPDDERTLLATSKFVNAATTSAKAAEGEGNLSLARTLLGHASNLQPDDEELRKQLDDVDARYRESVGALGGDAGEPAAETTPEQEDVEEVEEPAPTPTKPKVETKPKPKPQPKPDIADVLKRARAAYSRDDSKTAESLYKEALSINSRDHTANAGLGQVYFDSGSYATAVRYQMQAVRAKPNRVEYRINLGQSYYRLGKYNDAIRSWEAALARDPNNSNAKRYIELAKKKL